MIDIVDHIGDIATIGAFTLAALIAIVGINQAKKKDTDRVYEYLEIITNLKMELEFALASYSKNPTDIEIFNRLDTRYTAFVNYLEYFSAKILNQNLYKNKAFKDFQGESHHGLKEWAIIQLKILFLIKSIRFKNFGITSAAVTKKSNLKNTYQLLEATLPKKDYNDLQDLCRKYGLY